MGKKNAIPKGRVRKAQPPASEPMPPTACEACGQPTQVFGSKHCSACAALRVTDDKLHAPEEQAKVRVLRDEPIENDKRPVGRPSKYLPELHCKQVTELCLLGLTDEEIARVFDISVATLNNWKKDYPEFLEAMRDGKEKADARVASRLYQRAMGYEHADTDIRVVDKSIVETPIIKIYPPDTRAAEFWLKNRQPSRFRERTVTEVSGVDGAPIETVTGTLTDYAALRDKIKGKRGEA